MAQIFGILGFFLSMLAIFFASEILRRSHDRQVQLETALFKMQIQIQDIEKKIYHVNRLAKELNHQKKRQADTITAFAAKGEDAKDNSKETTKENPVTERTDKENKAIKSAQSEKGRFIPSQNTTSKTG